MSSQPSFMPCWPRRQRGPGRAAASRRCWSTPETSTKLASGVSRRWVGRGAGGGRGSAGSGRGARPGTAHIPLPGLGSVLLLACARPWQRASGCLAWALTSCHRQQGAMQPLNFCFFITRISQAQVELLDPEVRCFSDTPAWLEANQHRLANRRILMYCTGGVRWDGGGARWGEGGGGAGSQLANRPRSRQAPAVQAAAHVLCAGVTHGAQYGRWELTIMDACWQLTSALEHQLPTCVREDKLPTSRREPPLAWSVPPRSHTQLLLTRTCWLATPRCRCGAPAAGASARRPTCAAWAAAFKTWCSSRVGGRLFP